MRRTYMCIQKHSLDKPRRNYLFFVKEMQSSTLINHEFVPHDSQHIIHRCCHRFPPASVTLIRRAVPSFSGTEKKLDNRPHPSCSWEHFAPCPVKDLERALQPKFEGNLLWEWLFALLRVWNQYRSRKYKFPLCLDRAAGCCTEFPTFLIIRFRELQLTNSGVSRLEAPKGLWDIIRHKPIFNATGAANNHNY